MLGGHCELITSHQPGYLLYQSTQWRGVLVRALTNYHHYNMLVYLLLVSFLASFTTADWRFWSRTDLSPPRLNITVPADPSVEPGFIFVAPYAGFQEGSYGPQQPGAYIFRDNGDLVWSGVGYLAGWIANFQVSTWKGQQVLRAFEGVNDHSHGRMYGKHSILNDHYQVIKVVRPGSHRLNSAHEFRVLDSGTVLVETPVPTLADLTRWGGDKDQKWIVSNGFQGIFILF